MADNVAVTAGTGTTIHADEYTHGTLGSGKTQLVKLVDGALDSDTAISVDVGAKANALRVAPANDITDGTYIGDVKFGEAEPNSAAILSDTTDIKTAIELLDNAVDGNYLNVNLNAAGSDIAVGEGVISAQTQRVTIATDDDGVAHLATIAGDTTSIDGKITACNTGAVVLAASDGTDIGDVDVASIAAGTNVIGKIRLVTATGDEVTEDTDDSLQVTIVADDVGIGGGTQYTEDDAVPANPVGNALLVERDDALAGITPAEGDWTQLFGDANGALWTHDAALDACISGSELQVDVVASIPAGDNNIGNVDIASSVALDVSAATVTVDGTVTANLSATDNTVLDNIDANTDFGAVVGGGAEATALRVTLANDSTGVISVDDGGGALTVDGTITANLGATDNAVLDSIQTATEATQTACEVLDNAISGSEMQVDIVASLPAGSNAIGKLAANSGVDIGDVDVTSIVPGTGATNLGKEEDAAHSSGDVGVMALSVRSDTASQTAGTNGDYSPLLTDGQGKLWVRDGSFDDFDLDTGAGLEQRVCVGLLGAGDGGSTVLLGDSDGLLVNLGGNNDVVSAGDVAHDSSDSGNPVKVGGKAVNMDGTAPGTAVTEGDRANFITDTYGRQCVETVHPNFGKATANYGSAQTDTEVVATPGAGLSLYVTDIILSTDTAGSIKLVEDTASAVDIVELMYFAANGGAVIPLRTPIKLTANKNLGITSTIAGNHSITISYYVAP